MSELPTEPMPEIRRTKIVATLGPASRHPDVLRGLLEAGADVVRVTSPTAPSRNTVVPCRRREQPLDPSAEPLGS